jgi:hypothetical protein
MAQEFRQAMFDECVHSEFEIIENSAAVCVLELTDVVERMKTPVQETFSLMFRGPLTLFVPQGIRTLKHGKLGELDIFLVPVGKEEDGFQYEAVFNKLLKPRE